MGEPVTYEIRRTSTASVTFESGAEPPVRLVKVAPGVTIREVIVEEQAPSHHAYSIRSVIPIKDHRADVWLTARADGGTDIRWASSMRPKLPGTGLVLKAALSKAVGDLCKALVKAAEVKP